MQNEAAVMRYFPELSLEDERMEEDYYENFYRGPNIAGGPSPGGRTAMNEALPSHIMPRSDPPPSFPGTAAAAYMGPGFNASHAAGTSACPAAHVDHPRPIHGLASSPYGPMQPQNPGRTRIVYPSWDTSDDPPHPSFKPWIPPPPPPTDSTVPRWPEDVHGVYDVVESTSDSTGRLELVADGITVWGHLRLDKATAILRVDWGPGSRVLGWRGLYSDLEDRVLFHNGDSFDELQYLRFTVEGIIRCALQGPRDEWECRFRGKMVYGEEPNLSPQEMRERWNAFSWL